MIDFIEISDIFASLQELLNGDSDVKREIELDLKNRFRKCGLTRKECNDLTAGFFKWMEGRPSFFSEDDALIWLEREVDRIKKERKGGKKKSTTPS